MDSNTTIDELECQDSQITDEHIVGDIAAWFEACAFCVVIAFFAALISQMYLLYLSVFSILVNAVY